ncbi:MAG: single-stranded-DNA-specific exonuclease RecJ, partial [Desulfovibrionales bacterium]
HLPGPQLPACRGLVNPKLKPCSCTDLAGVGIAFFLAASLNRLLPGEPLDVRQFLDLVALGTVADVVPLTGQNRILVKNGLLLLNSPDRPGVKALKEVCGFAAESRLGSGEISFGLAPRINAAGRMGDPTSALELLLTRDGDSAKKLAEGLNALNAERKKEEERILSEAVKQASQCQDSPGLVLHGSWHQGVIGIVASRIVEQFHRPSIVLCEDGDELKGSARSIPGFDLYEGLTSCQDILLRYGGHAQAAGLTLAPDSLESFRELFSAAVREQIGERLPEPTVTVEEELGFDRIDPVLLGELELLQPYGLGNPRPLFASPPLEVRKQNFFGNGKHVGLDLRDTAGKITYRGCAFRQAEHVQELSPLTGKTVRVAFTPRTSTFNGMSRIDLAVKHFLEIT